MDMNILQHLLTGGAPAPLGVDVSPLAATAAPVQQAPVQQAPVQQAPVQQAPAQQAPAPAPDPTPAPAGPRRSILDTIGRISDVLAKVGGAEALYQPTLDANTARANAVGDHAQAVDLEKQRLSLGGQSIESGTQALQDHASARMGAAVRGLAAIQNGGGDVTKAWPILAQQLNITPEQSAQISEHLAQDPKGTIQALDAALSAPTTASPDKVAQDLAILDKRDPTGKLSQTYLAHVADPTAVTPYQQAQIDARNRQLGISETSTAANIRNQQGTLGERQYEFDNPNPKAGKAGTPSGSANVSTAVNALTSLHNSMGDLIRDPNLRGATGLLEGHLNLTSGQREIEGRVASLVGQGIPAAIAAIKAAGGAAPRAVSEITGEAKGLMGAIQNRQMDTEDYVKNIVEAQARLTQRIQQMQEEAGSTSSGASSPPPRSTLPPRISPRGPSVTRSGHVLTYNPKTGKIE